MFRTALVCLTLAAMCLAAGTYAGASADEDFALPALASKLPFQGGEILSLRGLHASDSMATDLSLVNLSKSANRCTLALADGNGEAIGPVITLTLRGLEERPFLDAFERLVGPEGVADARATVSCSRAFSAYGFVTDRAQSRVDVISPEASYDAVEALPAPVEVCPAGAVCFDSPGVIHIPQTAKPVGRVAYPAPAGVAKRLRLSLDVTVGDWYPKETNGKHLIYWFVINKNIDMAGMLYFRGPGKNQAFGRHGIGLTHPQKIKIIKPFAAQAGRTYHVENDYDMAAGVYTITVTEAATGNVKAALRGKPNLASYNIKPGAKFLVDMGFPPNKVATEVPSYGWVYSNVHVEAYMK